MCLSLTHGAMSRSDFEYLAVNNKFIGTGFSTNFLVLDKTLKHMPQTPNSN